MNLNFNRGEGKDKPEEVWFKFNNMTRVGPNDKHDDEEEQKRVFEQLIFTDDGTLGEYDLAEKKLSVSVNKYRASVSK